jgi:hypothetical protein
MSIDDLEAKALKLDSRDRARLAAKLLESLEELSEEENERLWVEEAMRRDAEMDAQMGPGNPASDALRRELDRRLEEHLKAPEAARSWQKVRESLERALDHPSDPEEDPQQ